MFSSVLATALLSLAVFSASATPLGNEGSELVSRAAADNTVSISSTTKFCMIMPRNPHTDIGDSEHPGGTKSYCSSSARTSSTQGQIPSNFWSNVAYKTGKGKSGGKYAQRMSQSVDNTTPVVVLEVGETPREVSAPDTVITSRHRFTKITFAQIVEPAENRACIRCCANASDCPTNKGKALLLSITCGVRAE
ncbi:hypothetical protein HWV62_28838 [Athelia sp. TMB]|nr:hypothetical protein HWV62_44701 [Athelia sp. TMB]KAF7968941.1 hypothetical protein HWV62_28838 [Athelia sp. TMB]